MRKRVAVVGASRHCRAADARRTGGASARSRWRGLLLGALGRQTTRGAARSPGRGAALVVPRGAAAELLDRRVSAGGLNLAGIDIVFAAV